MVDQNLITLFHATAFLYKDRRNVGTLEFRYAAWTDRGWTEESLALEDLQASRGTAHLTLVLNQQTPPVRRSTLEHHNLGKAELGWLSGTARGYYSALLDFPVPPPLDEEGYKQFTLDLLPKILGLSFPGGVVQADLDTVRFGEWRPRIYLGDTGPLEF